MLMGGPQDDTPLNFKLWTNRDPDWPFEKSPINPEPARRVTQLLNPPQNRMLIKFDEAVDNLKCLWVNRYIPTITPS
jgi:hypothetical protein